MSSVGYHEPVGGLPGETRDMHRAIVSLMPPWCSRSHRSRVPRLMEVYDMDEPRFQRPVGLQATPKRNARASRLLSAVQSRASGVNRTDASKATSMAPQPES